MGNGTSTTINNANEKPISCKIVVRSNFGGNDTAILITNPHTTTWAQLTNRMIENEYLPPLLSLLLHIHPHSRLSAYRLRYDVGYGTIIQPIWHTEGIHAETIDLEDAYVDVNVYLRPSVLKNVRNVGSVFSPHATIFDTLGEGGVDNTTFVEMCYEKIGVVVDPFPLRKEMTNVLKCWEHAHLPGYIDECTWGKAGDDDVDGNVIAAVLPRRCVNYADELEDDDDDMTETMEEEETAPVVNVAHQEEKIQLIMDVEEEAAALEKCNNKSIIPRHHLQTIANHTVEKFPSTDNGSNLVEHSLLPRREDQAVRGREVGRIRRYNEQNRAYGAWEYIHISNSGPDDGFMRIDLNRGGKVCLYTKMLPQEKQKSLSTAMHQCKLFRQYTRCQVFHEPRSHVLLSSKAHHHSSDVGYMYHGIKMKALPIGLVPEIESYACELARYYRLPQNQWDIGVDLIVYKDGEDSIGWHADNTQGESVVLCVVVDSPGAPRPVHIRPNKRTKLLADGDEEVQLYVREGDAYDMDGKMQAGYEHSLPKKEGNKSHRLVLIFRHGDEASVANDSGVPITEMAERRKLCLQMPAPDAKNDNLISVLSQLRFKLPCVAFGHPQGVLEGSLHSRLQLYSINAHRSDRRGVNGNIQLGSDSIIVSRQSADCREEDGLQWVRYTCSRHQGGGALCLSYNKGSCIRVFRSSNLKSKYAPPGLQHERTCYRYDGLYMITTIWDSSGALMIGGDVEIPVGGAQFTFHLERRPKVEASEFEADESFCNSMNVDELWRKIQQPSGYGPTVQFVLPCPISSDTLCKLQNAAPPIICANRKRTKEKM